MPNMTPNPGAAEHDIHYSRRTNRPSEKLHRGNVTNARHRRPGCVRSAFEPAEVCCGIPIRPIVDSCLRSIRMTNSRGETTLALRDCQLCRQGSGNASGGRNGPVGCHRAYSRRLWTGYNCSMQLRGWTTCGCLGQPVGGAERRPQGPAQPAAERPVAAVIPLAGRQRARRGDCGLPLKP